MSKTWIVKPENRKKFEREVTVWGVLIHTLGWDTLCEMYVNRVPPFGDVPKLKGKMSNKLKKAKDIILATLAHDLKQAGLEAIDEVSSENMATESGPKR